MGLAQLQFALARLYTQASAREELQRDPGTFATRHQLTVGEASELACCVLGDAGHFADALLRKRRDEAAKSIGLVVEKLPTFAGWFSKFAESTPLGAQRNPALDARDFLRWLRTRVTNRDVLDRIRYFEARITMMETKRRFLARWTWCPEDERKRLVVWWRWRGKVYVWRFR